MLVRVIVVVVVVAILKENVLQCTIQTQNHVHPVYYGSSHEVKQASTIPFKKSGHAGELTLIMQG